MITPEEKTNHFFNNLEKLSKKNRSADFFIISVAQELVDIYMKHFDGKIRECINFFEVVKNNEKDGPGSINRVMAGLCLTVIHLKIAVAKGDEKVKTLCVKKMNELLKIITILN